MKYVSATTVCRVYSLERQTHIIQNIDTAADISLRCMAENGICSGKSAGRSGVIRTLDPHVPNVVRYQTALHSVTSGASIDQRFSFHKHGNAKSRKKVEKFVTHPGSLLSPQDHVSNPRCRRGTSRPSPGLEADVAEKSPMEKLRKLSRLSISRGSISQ
jgi:hypothetical protein